MAVPLTRLNQKLVLVHRMGTEAHAALAALAEKCRCSSHQQAIGCEEKGRQKALQRLLPL
jgi:hypothetical protein